MSSGFPRLTSSGRALVAVVGFGAAAAYGTGWAALAAVTVAAAVLLLTALLVVARPARPAGTVRLEQPRVRRGDPAFAVVEVAGARGASTVTLEGAVDPEHAVLGPVRTGATRVPVRTSRHGRFAVGPLTVHRRDPFGLAERRTGIADASTLLVTPRPVPVRGPALGRIATSDPDDAGAEAGDGVADHSLREYVPGDDLRRVHWATLARTGTLHVRPQLAPVGLAHVVLLDTRPDAFDDDESFEAAVDVAASVLLAAGPVRSRGTLRTGSGRTVEYRDRRRADDVLDRLALVGAEPGDAPLRAGTGRAALLTVVTGLVERGQAGEVARCSERYGRTVLVRVGVSAERRTVTGQGDVTTVVARGAADAAAAWERAAAR
ncbi:DUF58 domain-containing protein [Cryptosporangium japonicum]|uniref:DUF58 domain-containing protein n=1 Tax=Cryptosporangium japonicum TaxID=80872 RepID=A0ABN0V6I9_9ACTN